MNQYLTMFSIVVTMLSENSIRYICMSRSLWFVLRKNLYKKYSERFRIVRFYNEKYICEQHYLTLLES